MTQYEWGSPPSLCKFFASSLFNRNSIPHSCIDACFFNYLLGRQLVHTSIPTVSTPRLNTLFLPDLVYFDLSYPVLGSFLLSSSPAPIPRTSKWRRVTTPAVCDAFSCSRGRLGSNSRSSWCRKACGAGRRRCGGRGEHISLETLGDRKSSCR